MVSFAQNLRSFRSGGLSLDDLLGEVDRILATDRGPDRANWLLATLTEEEAKSPLPSNACTLLREKLEPLTQTGKQPPGEAAAEKETAIVQRETAYLQGKSAMQNTGQRPPGDTDAPGHAVAEEIKTTGDILNNRFELEECLGSGGMSTVYKAVDRRRIEADDRNPYVAVKVLNLEFRAHPSALMALQREAKKCQSLAHPNIVRVYDFDRDGSTVYMTMEHLSGQSLGRKLSESGFKGKTEDEVLRIINDAGKALSFAHESGIVHADFKPANVFITDSGKVKVIDFGIARAFHKDDATSIEATRFDAGSLGALTPTYASPEMLEHQEPDPRDDIYALACTAFEMLTGRHPFGRLQATAARDGGLQLKHHKALSWSQFRALKHALDFDRDKRTPSVAQFLKELNRKVVPAGRLLTVLGLSAAVMIVAVSASLYYLVRPDDRRLVDGASQLTEAAQPSASAGVESISQPPASEEITPAEFASLLAGIPCSALRGSRSDDALSVRGYAREADSQKLQNALAPVAGLRHLDLSGIETVTRVHCPVIELLSGYWASNQTPADKGTRISSNKADNRFLKGENLVLDITTPTYPSYVNVDYYSLDGNVLHMLPSPRFRENQAPAGYTATIGDLGEWTVAEPFGTELIVILTTPEPLFESLRKEHEPQTSYLVDLKARLEKLTAQEPAHPVTADFILIRTQDR